MPVSSHSVVAAAIAAVREDFHANVGFGLRYAAGAPPAADSRNAETDLLRHVVELGERALRLYAERANATTAAAVRAGLYVLALVPLAGCPLQRAGAVTDGSSTAPEDDPARTAAAVGAYAVTALGIDPSARLDARAEVLDVLPPGWREALRTVFEALPWSTARGETPQQAATAVVRLALLALSRGLVAPDPAVSWDDLSRWAAEAGWRRRTIAGWRRALLGAEVVLANARRANGDVIDSATASDPRAALHAWLLVIRDAHVTAGPRGLRATLERLGRPVPPRVSQQADATPDPDAVRLGLGAAEQDQLALLRAVAPDFVDLILAPRSGSAKRGHAAELRPGTASNVLSLVDRLLAQFVRCWPDRALNELNPADLLTECVPVTALRLRLPAEEGQRWVERALKRAVDVPTVPILLFLFDQQLDGSRAHSPQVRHAAIGETIGYTQSLVKEARAFCHAFRRAAVWRTAYQTAARAELDRHAATADEVAATMERTLGAQPDRPKVKDVRRLLNLVSWPQLLCAGLPRLRAHVYALRRALGEKPRFGGLPVDPATYDEYLELYIVLAVFCADPLRIKNWMYARIGHEIALTLDPRAAVPTILGVHTHFTGDGDENYSLAALKISRDGSGLRDRELDWAIGAVDLTLLLEYMTRVRAPRAAAHVGHDDGDPARVPGGEYVGLPLFLTPPRTRPRARTAHASTPTALALATAMGEDALRRKFAQALHWVVRQALGRNLPSWEDFEPVRGDLYFGVFTPHIVRALMATYLLKVRARGLVGDTLDVDTRAGLKRERSRVRTPADCGESTRVVATRLLGDREKTLHRSYVAWSKPLAARLREPVDGWTHPSAYDRWIDRLLCVPGPIDWSAEPDLPLPPTCTHADLRVW